MRRAVYKYFDEKCSVENAGSINIASSNQETIPNGAGGPAPQPFTKGLIER